MIYLCSQRRGETLQMVRFLLVCYEMLNNHTWIHLLPLTKCGPLRWLVTTWLLLPPCGCRNPLHPVTRYNLHEVSSWVWQIYLKASQKQTIKIVAQCDIVKILKPTCKYQLIPLVLGGRKLRGTFKYFEIFMIFVWFRFSLFDVSDKEAKPKMSRRWLDNADFE